MTLGATARVITASNRAAAGVYEDRTGPLIVDWLRVRGYDVAAPVVRFRLNRLVPLVRNAVPFVPAMSKPVI